MPHLARPSSAFPHLVSRSLDCARSSGKFEGTGLRYIGNDEPKVGELLADPMLARVLASDGVAHEDLTRLVQHMRERLSA